jgi:hypothetical protein
MRKGGQNMDAVYDLKDMLCEELEEYGKKDKLDVGGLEIVDKLAHTIKNLDKIIETYEDDGYSEAYYDGSYENGTGNMGGGSYARRYSRERGGSYAMARGDGRGRGRNAKRDSMGRYSRDGKMMAQELRELMEDAPDERIKMELQKVIQKVENM